MAGEGRFLPAAHRFFPVQGVRLPQPTGPATLEAQFLAHRGELLRFLAARGAGDAAEDLLHELWLKLSAQGEIAVMAPRPYLMRAANRLMIDRHRSLTQGARRDAEWHALASEAQGASPAPAADRVVAGRQALARVEAALASLGERPAAIFRRHRVEDIPQRIIAEEFGVSLSTVEADLRRAYRALAELKERGDEV